MLTGFDAIAKQDAKILILGSMPSTTSLDKIQYYAHPQNCFWTIIESLFSNENNLDYQSRINLLHQNKIAVWDVLKNCKRSGSLDSAIEKDSMIPNNFNAFFAQYPLIKYIFFNGTKSETEFKKQVIPNLSQNFSHLEYYRLPSTSPAMATLKPVEKLKIWTVIKKQLDNKT